MKKFLILALVALALFASCSTSGDDDEGIDGTWTMTSIDGKSAEAWGGLYTMTLTITNGTSYKTTGTVLGFRFSESGTFTAQSDSVYKFTSSDGDTAAVKNHPEWSGSSM